MGSNVVAFPLCRQRKLVTGIAHMLHSKQGEAATLFWRETAQSLLQRLMASGLDRAAAEEQVRELLYAVLAEVEAEAKLAWR